MTLLGFVPTPGDQEIEGHPKRLRKPHCALEAQVARALTALDAADLPGRERTAPLELVLRPAALAAELLRAPGDISAEAHRLAIMAIASGAPQLTVGAG